MGRALSDQIHRRLTRLPYPAGMTKPANPFRYFNSSPEVIRLVVMMYVKYPLSLRNVEDLLHERGIDISYGDDVLGVTLMRNAFHPDNGPLTDMTTVRPEREAVAALFAGAIGHAKNPPSHRDVNHNRATAARLIIFASHLLEIVRTREVFL